MAAAIFCTTRFTKSNRVEKKKQLGHPKGLKTRGGRDGF